MTIDWNLMQELRNFLARIPAQAFDHDTWGEPSDPNMGVTIKTDHANICGTSACIAGWGAMLWDLGEPDYTEEEDGKVYLNDFNSDPGDEVADMIGLDDHEKAIIFYPWSVAAAKNEDFKAWREDSARLQLLHLEPSEERYKELADAVYISDFHGNEPSADLRTAVKFLDICIAKKKVLLLNWVEAGDAVRAEEEAIREALADQGGEGDAVAEVAMVEEKVEVSA